LADGEVRVLSMRGKRWRIGGDRAIYGDQRWAYGRIMGGFYGLKKLRKSRRTSVFLAVSGGQRISFLRKTILWGAHWVRSIFSTCGHGSCHSSRLGSFVSMEIQGHPSNLPHTSWRDTGY